MRSIPLVGALVLSLWTGCGRGFAPPPIEASALLLEQEERAVRLISDRIELSGRLRTIEFAIVTAAAPFCRGVERPAIGAVLASEESFSGDIARTAARDKIGLDERLTLVSVVPGGPLDEAGVRANDVVVSVEGQQVATHDAFFEQVGAHPERFSLRVSRDGTETEHQIRPAPACPVSLNYVQSAQLLPGKLTRTTAGFPRGAIRLFDDDDSIAILIGHQLAHLIFERPGEDEIESERRADRLGLFLTARAGYEVTRAMEVWETLVGEYPWIASPRNPDRYRAYPHQAVALRTSTIRSTITEIEDLMERKLPLVPTD